LSKVEGFITLLGKSSKEGAGTMLQMEQEIVLTLKNSEVLLMILKRQVLQKVLEVAQKLSKEEGMTLLLKKLKITRKLNKGALAIIPTRKLSKEEVATKLLKRLSKAEVVTTRFKIDLLETDPERRLGLLHRQRWV
jgi:hypothetical protein